MNILDEGVRNQVGYSFIMNELQVITCYGKEKKKSIKPYNDKIKLTKEFDNIEKVVNSVKKYNKDYLDIENIFYNIKNIKNSIERCKKNNVLDEVEIFEIKKFVNFNIELKSILRKIELNIGTLYDLNSLYKLLDPENKKIQTFYIYETYSSKLRKIRKNKRRLENLIINEADEGKLEELKQQRLDYVVLEQKEEYKVRTVLTYGIKEYADKISENIDVIGDLDFIIAKAKLAIKYNAAKPLIIDDMNIILKDAVNPYVINILNKSNKKFTPISIELKNGTTVITGANMGGKSITLKTIALNVYLANLGFFVFCKEACVPVLEFMDFLSDDIQSVTKGLSTFGAEIIRLNTIIENIRNKKSFVILDEFARGTNPQEGYYMVKSLCRYLNRFKSISLLTTHYDNVYDEDMVHYEVVGLKNTDFNKLKQEINLNKERSVDLIQKYMDYRLEKVTEKVDVPKDALNIAILLGIQKDIVDIIKKFYEEDDTNGR